VEGGGTEYKKGYGRFLTNRSTGKVFWSPYKYIGYVEGKDITKNQPIGYNKDYSLAEKLIREQGFDSLPKVVSEKELDEYIKANGTPELYRGVTEERAQMFCRGNMAISTQQESHYGSGIYAGNVFSIAERYEKGYIHKLSLIKEARIETYSKIIYAGDRRDKQDYWGNIKIARGVDAIQVKGAGLNRAEDYWVIFNRTAVIIADKNYRR